MFCGFGLVLALVFGVVVGAPMLASETHLMRMGFILTLYNVSLIPTTVGQLAEQMKTIYLLFWIVLGFFLYIWVPVWAISGFSKFVLFSWPLYYALEGFYLFLVAVFVSDRVSEWTKIRERARVDEIGWPEQMILGLSFAAYSIAVRCLWTSYTGTQSANMVFVVGMASVVTVNVMAFAGPQMEHVHIFEPACFTALASFVAWLHETTKGHSLRTLVTDLQAGELSGTWVWGSLLNFITVSFVLLTLPMLARMVITDDQLQAPKAPAVPNPVTQLGPLPAEHLEKAKAPPQQRSSNEKPKSKCDADAAAETRHSANEEPRPDYDADAAAWTVATILAISFLSKRFTPAVETEWWMRSGEIAFATGLCVVNAMLGDD